MVQHKQAERRQGHSRIVVAGCLVERYRDEIQKNIPEVDAVVGTGELEAILAAAEASLPPATQSRTAPSTFSLQSSLASRAPSAVHQHSHPTELGAQLHPRDQANDRKAVSFLSEGAAEVEGTPAFRPKLHKHLS